MATTPMPYAPYQPATAQYNPGRASTTSDPRKIAANQLQQVQGQGSVLQSNEQDLANQYGQQASGVESYLNPIESNLAQGGGGYNAAEQSQIQLDPATKAQIQLSPQDKQNIITGAGISAGANTAAGVGAAERAAAAAGGNPAALATYRARAAQTQGAQAGDAMTQARVAAQQVGSQGAQSAQQLQSQGAQAVGQARMGQQSQGLGYYGGLQQEKAGQSLAEQGLQNQTYGTQTSGTGQASGLGVQASQTPSTFDKVMGGVAGVAGALLADGTSSEDSDSGGMDAVLGEDGPEVIVEHASDPVRSHTNFMAGGTAGAGSDTGSTGIFQRFKNYLGTPGAAQPAATPAPAPAWNPTTPYSQLGTAIGQGASKLIAGMADGHPGYRARPHMADGGSAESTKNYAPPVPRPELPAALQGRPPAVQANIDGDEDAMRRLGAEERRVRAATPGDPRGLADWAHHDMQSLAESAMRERRANPPRTHMADGYRSRPMADGGDVEAGLPTPQAPKFNPGKLVTSPTRVHLDPGDQVVPLSYRPKAKIRPSAALSTLSPVRLAPRLKHAFGGPRA